MLALSYASGSGVIYVVLGRVIGLDEKVSDVYCLRSTPDAAMRAAERIADTIDAYVLALPVYLLAEEGD